MAVADRVTSLVEGIVIAIDALRANRVRAALTILGIAIGVFVVVVMSAAIQGINNSVAQEFEKAGPTTFFVNRFPISLEGCSDADDDSCKWRRNPPLRLTEAAAIGRLPTIEDITINTGTSAPAKYMDRVLSSMRISAHSANWIEVTGGDIVQGRNFTRAEETNGARVVVINEKAVERLFNGLDPLGKVLLLNKSPFRWSATRAGVTS
jgi:putative ABC transport system permease protein